MLVDLSGVEVFLYNNKDKFVYLDRLQRALREDALLPAAILQEVPPRLRHRMPPARFSIAPAVVYIGAPRLPTTLVLTFRRAFGLYFPRTGAPILGRSTLATCRFLDVRATFMRNDDFVRRVAVDAAHFDSPRTRLGRSDGSDTCECCSALCVYMCFACFSLLHFVLVCCRAHGVNARRLAMSVL